MAAESRNGISSIGLVASLLALVFASPTFAGPLDALVPIQKRVEADPNKEYVLNKKNGPWMIMVASFAGDNAEDEAKALVMELRKDHNVPAYIHRQGFDFTGKVVGLGVTPEGKPKEFSYANATKFDEIAVLAGNFPSIDPNEQVGKQAQRILSRIRSIEPKSAARLDADGDSTTTMRLIGLRTFYRKNSATAKSKKTGPFAKAFMTRNPIFPIEEFANHTIDPFVREMNGDRKHTLLKNPKRYTVLVAKFEGATAFGEKEFNGEIARSKESRLEKAAEKAEKLTMELRKSGVEAYQYHDRHESIVTIGGFDEIGMVMPDGKKTELEPKLAAIMTRYEADKIALPNGQFGLQPKKIAGIELSASPQIILVPKESVTDSFRHATAAR